MNRWTVLRREDEEGESKEEIPKEEELDEEVQGPPIPFKKEHTGCEEEACCGGFMKVGKGKKGRRGGQASREIWVQGVEADKKANEDRKCMSDAGHQWPRVRRCSNVRPTCPAVPRT